MELFTYEWTLFGRERNIGRLESFNTENALNFKKKLNGFDKLTENKKELVFWSCFFFFWSRDWGYYYLICIIVHNIYYTFYRGYWQPNGSMTLIMEQVKKVQILAVRGFCLLSYIKRNSYICNFSFILGLRQNTW